MKLLYVVNKIDGRGGLNRIAFDKINYLIDFFDIDIVFYGDEHNKPFYEVDSRVKFHPIKVDALSSYGKKFLFAWKAFREYRQLLKIIKPDIIINMNVNLLSWLIPFVGRSIPKIIELHQSFDGVKIFNENTYGKDSWKGKFSFFLRDTVYPKYDKVVVLTHTDMKKWGYRNMMVIPNFTNMQSPTTTDVSQPYFLWCGRLSNQKGFDYLISIWEEFCKQRTDWKLVLIGKFANKSPQQEKKFESFLERNQGTVDYVPETTDMDSYYNKAAIYISTSRYEGLPLCLIEAATKGKPIIGFDITGNDEVVSNNETGILVDSYNIHSFTEAMLRLCKDVETRKKYSQAAFQKAKIFNKESIMQSWLTLFRTIKQQKV
ncbi:glycosyltransferase [Prevotella dentasini]|uniref:glycosyltransferase n=1 Tax=Prevotella dentasini TaxID=589537 RepID=UPI0004696FA5|nr:glycosyltransferase [Prevotella dentasini]